MEQMTFFSMNEENEKNKTFTSICDFLDIENNAPAWPDKFGLAIKAWLKQHNANPIKTLSLFSGAGGLDIGFSDVGFDIISSVEIERKFCDTLELNTGVGKWFENSKVNCVDIKNFDGQELGQVDFIIGGPPCQTFSAAGRRANGVLGTTDARGVLFREYVRLLKELSPKGFLFENVYGIIGAQHGEAWKEILQAFSDVGYNLFYKILDAADYGVPQHRERLIIVGLKNDCFIFPRPTHGPDSIDHQPFYNAETALEGVTSSESDESNKLKGRYADLLDGIPPGLNYSFYTEEMGHPTPIFAWRSKFSDFLYKADPNLPVRTIKASGGAYTGPLHWDNRFFKCEEYKRLQTIPDNYQISGNKQTAIKQIGNSVPPQLARIMAIAIRQQVFETNFPFELSLLNNEEELSFRKRKHELTKIYKEKANKAIKNIEHEFGELPDSRVYYCSMDDCFSFKKTMLDNAEYKIDAEWGEILLINVYSMATPSKAPKISFTVLPNGQQWTLGINKVKINVYSNNIIGYTIAWKAFEQELIDNALKADLVQLNGYYQYPPKILIENINIDSICDFTSVLRAVMSNRNIPEFKTNKQLSKEWGISESNVLLAAEFLKQLGYEIRNHSTNPQIEEGKWLIPYAFPTLTPLSVQLRKKLK